ncbi:MAG: glycosyltransferase [Opitutales bacterium]|nr:glycosyltransferase [Opitutales bacterium]
MGGSVHILKRWPCGGGMEAIARWHLDRGEPIFAFAGKSELLVGDKMDGGDPAVHHGGAVPDRRVAAVAREACEVWSRARWTGGIFYNGYGLGWGTEPTPEARRILYLHSDYPGFNRWLRALAPYVDGVLCYNAALRDKTLSTVGGGCAERVFSLPLPVEIDEAPALEPPPSRMPVVIGYSGRVQIAQKRLDRLGAFFAALGDAGIDYRFEILGEGDALPELRRRFAGDRRVLFHGHCFGAAYRAVLRRWKYLFFCSDYEGLPVSLLEGVAAGAVPVYPDFHAGKDWPARLDPGLLYPMGDMKAAAEIIRRAETAWGPASWSLFRRRARALLAEHTRENYFAAFDAAVEAVAFLPPRRRQRPSPWLRFTPLWLAHRLEARRRGTHRAKGPRS